MLQMCECHDTKRQHDQWFEKESQYWRWYFGAQLQSIEEDIRREGEALGTD